MAGSTQSELETAASEAADWLIVLQEAPDDRQLRQQFERWRAASKANAEAWAGLRKVSTLIGAAGQVNDIASRNAQGSRFSRRTVAGMASIGMAACLLLVYAPAIILSLTADYVTGRAGSQEIVLSDGTHVHLGAESAINVDYSQQTRRVELLAGQAFFDVIRDESRPFRVTSGSAETVVLGTAFEIKRSSSANFVAVREGAVRVQAAGDAPRQEDRLQQGDTLRVSASGKFERGHIDPNEVASWLDGTLIVRNRPVKEVIETLKTYFDGVIVVADAALGEKRVTGVYDLSNPGEAVRAIAQAHNVQARSITPWILIVSAL